MDFIITGTLLIFLIATSFWLAFSGYLENRVSYGWIFLLFFFGTFFHFCVICFGRADDIASAIGSMALSAAILATQWPFVLELFSRSFLPDPSRGLKLIKTYSAAERRVAADDLPGAIEEYEKEIASDPGDLTARFRHADLCYQNKDYLKAVEAYKQLSELKSKLDVYQHCSALMRISEICAQNLDDVEQAREYLDIIIREHGDTKYAVFAADRLQNLS